MSVFDGVVSGGSDCQSLRTLPYSALLKASEASRSRVVAVEEVAASAAFEKPKATSEQGKKISMEGVITSNGQDCRENVSRSTLLTMWKECASSRDDTTSRHNP